VLAIEVTPNPVPWSDTPIDGCGSDRPNRWVWDQILRNTGGTRITLTERVNFFNGDQVSRPTGFSISIEPGASHTQTTRWCSALDGDHTFRTDWSGSDASGNRISLNGPTVTMRKK
jgi:hypothetical protein